VAGVVQGDLGVSVRTRRPVVTEIQERYAYTLVLTFASLLIALTVGLITGILAAVYKDSFIDNFTMFLALFGLSMPAFWFGLLMIQWFGVNLRWFPVMGASSWRHLVLPAMTLGLIASTVQARVVRSGMLEVLNSDYVRTARAKGLREWAVVLRHGLKNALIPTVTVLGLQVGGLLGGAFIIETVFAWPGIGELAVKAITQRDFPVIQGVIVVVAVTYVLVNLLVDLSYRVLDPRISYE
jgi:ABC-type dipeptide/oligopeptide/nickel transport system permease component